MALILAIEPDRRQAAHLSAVVRKRLRAELILVDTTERALDAIGNRVPDLVLVPALLSPQDDAALAAALRVIAAAANVQMLTIPVLGAPRPAVKAKGVLSALRRGRRTAEPDGCDPNVFADQIRSYLERAAQERATAAAKALDDEGAPEQPPAVGEPPSALEDSIAEFEAPLEAIAEPFAVVDEPIAVVDEPIAAADERMTGFDEPLVLADEQTAGFYGPVDALVEPFTPAVELFSDAAVSSADEAAAEDPYAAPVVEVGQLEGGEQEVDDGVSSALDEAVLALFSESRPELVLDPPSLTVAATVPPGAEAERRQVVERVESRPGGGTVEAWPAVEELLAALEETPLAVINVGHEGDWLPPVSEASGRLIAELHPAGQEHQEDDIDLTAELRAPAAGALLEDEVFEIAVEELVPPAAAAHAEPSPVAGKSEREWVALIESLRHDVDRLRTERAEKPAQRTVPRPVRTKKAKPVQDEWGFFDPEQCGFAALLAKLDEVTESDEGVMSR